MQQRIDGGHVPVLLAESLAALAVRDDGVYVDATFGRGGHARAMLDVARRARRARRDRPRSRRRSRGCARSSMPRFTFRRAWFSELPDVLAALGDRAVDGVLLDLGVSSPQLDDPARGFSYRFDGPLDMRMDPSRGETRGRVHRARDRSRELTEVIRDYGEERFAQSVARAIAKARDVATDRHDTRSSPRSSRKPSARARGVIGVRIRPRAPSRPFGLR